MADGVEDAGGDGEVTVAALRRGGAKAVRVRAGGWTKAKRGRFLDMLSATAHVGMAAAAAGMGTRSAYGLRRRDPAFAALWSAALQIGYERLEEGLLSAALGHGDAAVSTINAIEPDGEAAAASIDQELALRVLALRRAEGAGARSRQRHGYKLVPIEEVEKALSRQLDLCEARLRRRLSRDVSA